MADRETPTPAINGQIPATEGGGYTVDAENSVPVAHAAALDCSRAEENLPVFGWAANGMDWKLHIAYRDKTDDGVMILGPLDSGRFGSVMAFFKLFETATALARWVKEKYWMEFRSIVQI